MADIDYAILNDNSKNCFLLHLTDDSTPDSEHSIMGVRADAIVGLVVRDDDLEAWRKEATKARLNGFMRLIFPLSQVDMAEDWIKFCASPEHVPGQARIAEPAAC